MRRAAHPTALDDAAMQRALARLRELVQARRLKHSAIRDAVARAALACDGHFTIEDLVAKVRERGASDAHPATIYRVVPLLVEAGLIQRTLVSAGEGQRYERAFEREHHDHLLCTACFKVIEFEFEAIEVLQHHIAEQFGFHLTGHIHELLGLCKECHQAAPRGTEGSLTPPVPRAPLAAAPRGHEPPAASSPRRSGARGPHRD